MGAVKTTTMVVVVIPALVLGLPIFDTVFAIVRRVVRRQPIGRGDKEHLHHRILRAGYGQRRAVMIMYCISGLLGIMAVIYSRGLMVECIGLLLIAAILLYVLLGNDTVQRLEMTRQDSEPQTESTEKETDKSGESTDAE